MKPRVRQGAVGALLLALVLVIVSLQSQSQVSKRKIMEHAAPPYPALARSMALRGVVKVEALVAADGSVKNTEVKGGHPVLAQAAVNAVRRWRWEAASHESHEIVEISFYPE